MRTGLRSLFQRALKKAPPVNAVECGMAKTWVKRRLLALYPALRNHPEALDAAYEELDLEPRRGREDGEFYAYFQVKGPK
ncbi:MAG: hypothetical protein PHQ12_00265 [Chthoniobacteraceae bacterium]|nr:hypothetical protein [Chthoniobacteraceae bacterium]